MSSREKSRIREEAMLGELTLVVLVLVVGLMLATSAAGQQRPTRRTSQCSNQTCHPGLVDKQFNHGPGTGLTCLSCHEFADANQHLFRLTEPRRDLCGSCHELELDEFLHFPVADNNCLGCHDPHGSDFLGMLVTDKGRGLCVSCHNQDFSALDFVHGPVAIGACVICHESHSAPHEALLPKPEHELCQDCHMEMTATGLATRHLHKPLEDGCSTCHDPHASNFEFQLEHSSPELCFTCHEGVRNQLSPDANVHGPSADEGGCVECHNPHFTQLPRLQREPQPELCLECHSEPVVANDGRELPDMAKLLRDNPNHHGPIREGACTTCHRPHAAKIFSLLYQEYPEEFYAPFEKEDYALCFSCHIPDMVLDESGSGLTNFRQGDQNLHWLHVNREKGRTCRACHEVHASKQPFHMREAVPFGRGGWMLQINFEQADHGGSCRPGCHKPKAYDRLAATPPADDNAAPRSGE